MKYFWHAKDGIKIKICGINSLDVAYESSLLGAHALGFHLWRTDDYDSRINVYKNIINYVPKKMSIWLLTDIDAPDTIANIIKTLKIDTLQFQGKIEPIRFNNMINRIKNMIRGGDFKIVKSIGCHGRTIKQVMSEIDTFNNIVDAFVIDSMWKGGSGKENDWDLCKSVIENISKPVIIAGGLNPNNVSHIIQITKPYGVDVESGVEHIVGIYQKKKVKCKSIKKIEAFITNVMEA